MLLCEYVFMRTTIDLPDLLFREAKAKAAREGTSLKEFFTQAVEEKLNRQTTPLKRTRVKLPIFPKGTLPDFSDLNNTDIERILRDEDISR